MLTNQEPQPGVHDMYLNPFVLSILFFSQCHLCMSWFLHCQTNCFDIWHSIFPFCSLAGVSIVKSRDSLLCSWAYVSCQNKTHVHFWLNIQKACRAPALFFKMGKWLWHFPQPRFQAVGLARWSVKLKYQRVSTSWKTLGMTKTLDTCPEGGTCPLLKHTCVSLRVGDEKPVGGKRKTEPPERRKQVTTFKSMKLT